MQKITTAIIALLLLQMYCNAQNMRKEKFGNIKIEDFNPVSSVITEDAQAVILSDVGSTEFEGSSGNNWFNLIYKHHKKILIKKKAAFDLATVQEKLYNRSFDSEERLDNIEAATYNLIDGKIVVSKLEIKKDVQKEQLNKSQISKKFTLPDIKEGCIIEYSYTIKSKNMSDLHGWEFQDIYPTLWSEYHVVIPPMLNYLQQRKGIAEKYTIDSAKTVFKNYTIIFDGGTNSNEYANNSGDAKWALWARKDVPAFKLENYTTTLRNYLSSIEFHLFSVKISADKTEQVIKDWFTTANNLLKNPAFGEILDVQKNEWLAEEANKIIGNSTELEAAEKVYNYFRDNFKCVAPYGVYFTNEPKKIWKEKTGLVSDINLLLAGFLNSLGFKVTPVLSSVKQYGRPDEFRAILSQYNYLITHLVIDDKVYLLDASEKELGFGKLPLKCYNGMGRRIATVPSMLNLSPDSLIESKSTSIFIINSEAKKGTLEASFSSKLGYYESMDLRETLVNTKKEDFFKEISKSYTFEINLQNPELEEEKNLKESINFKYDFETTLNDEDLIYFNPLLGEATKTNPFKSAERNYPVEMDYQTDETIILDMEIPKGYMVDELPKSTRVKLNENEGMFEYIIVNREGKIQLRNRIQVKKAIFDAEDYETLRNFWGMIVKKHAEQIVFKKIK